MNEGAKGEAHHLELNFLFKKEKGRKERRKEKKRKKKERKSEQESIASSSAYSSKSHGDGLSCIRR